MNWLRRPQGNRAGGGRPGGHRNGHRAAITATPRSSVADILKELGQDKEIAREAAEAAADRRHGRPGKPGQRDAHHPLRQSGPLPGRPGPRQRHSFRAVRRRIQNPLPRGRRALRNVAAAQAPGPAGHFPHQGHVQPEHLRTPPAAGRTHQLCTSPAATSTCASPPCPRSSANRSCLRVLDRAAVNLDIETLGFPKTVYDYVLEAIQQPNGIFVVTGPTGCGKTTTLYSCLRRDQHHRLQTAHRRGPGRIRHRRHHAGGRQRGRRA